VRKRPALNGRDPVHVIIRVTRAVGALRRRKAYQAIRRALLTVLCRGLIRVVHVSIQRNHIHLIVEAGDERALARGMQGFQISAAKQINIAISKQTGHRRTGQVFADRYHAEYLTSPRQVRHALCYVRNNWRRHGEDRRFPGVAFDPFSSGAYSGGWDDEAQTYWPAANEELLPICFPQTWLLEKGWRRHGLLSPWVTPGPT
jgi:REP element-mobilizing transposase RayT